MIIKIEDVKLNQTNTSQAGKTYTAHEVYYINADNKSLKKMIFTNSPVADDITDLAKGMNVEVKTQRDGKFFEWVSITPTDKPLDFYKNTGGGGGGFKKYTPKGNDNSLGMRVGNITTNATTVYSSKLTTSLKDAVDLVIEAQNYIEKKLSAPEAVVEVKTETTEETKTIDFEDLEDLDF